jgi:hypothetical protein
MSPLGRCIIGSDNVLDVQSMTVVLKNGDEKELRDFLPYQNHRPNGARQPRKQVAYYSGRQKDVVILSVRKTCTRALCLLYRVSR